MFKTLPGFREFYPEDCAIRNHCFRLWRQTALRFGFQEFDGPLLEPLELLTAKSGPEIAGQLFNFVDKGGREVTLRPELTPTLARMVGARANSLRRPIKWFSIGENFRYERQQKGRLRSFYQLNADLLGEPGPAADAEVIGLLVTSLTAFGLGPDTFIIRLSDRTLWLLYLEGLGLSETASMEILGVVDKMEREEPEQVLAKLKALTGEKAETLHAGIQALKACTDRESLAAFFDQASSDPVVAEKVRQRLAEWADLWGRLEAMGLGAFLRLDFGIVRGLAYYTGFVFEAFQTIGKGRALAGGGRYDHLVEKLGGPALPAVGFGMGDVTLRDLLETCNRLPKLVPSMDFYVIALGEAASKEALQAVYRLRESGFAVEYSLKAQSLAKQFKQADQSGARFALIWGEEEVNARTFKCRSLIQREEKIYPQGALAEVAARVCETAELP